MPWLKLKMRYKTKTAPNQLKVTEYSPLSLKFVSKKWSKVSTKANFTRNKEEHMFIWHICNIRKFEIENMNFFLSKLHENFNLCFGRFRIFFQKHVAERKMKFVQNTRNNKPVQFTRPQTKQLLEKRFDSFMRFNFVNSYYNPTHAIIYLINSFLNYY